MEEKIAKLLANVDKAEVKVAQAKAALASYLAENGEYGCIVPNITAVRKYLRDSASE